MNQYDDDAVDIDKTMFKPEPVENTKPTGKDSGKHVKGGVLPAYCDPPNPCPKGYTAEDGCIQMEEFENKAEFSRKYQASQNCMCDSEHMFSCPDWRRSTTPTSPAPSCPSRPRRGWATKLIRAA